MKKFFLLLSLLVFPKLFFCQDLVMVGIGDGNYTGSTLKFIELYAKKAVDLNNYQIEIFSNGQTNRTITIDLGKVVTPSEVAAGSRIFLRNGTDVSWNNLFNCENDFSSNRTIVKKAFVSFNGNDAIALALKTGQRIDLFGNIGEVNDKNDYSIPWNYQDGWAYRIDATSADGNYTQAHWVIKSSVFPTDLSTSNCVLGADKYPFAAYILPIQFVNIAASKFQNKIILKWSYVSYSLENQVESFELQTSKNGRNFKTHSTYLAETDKTDYSTILPENEQTLFYRIKVNTNESTFFSNLVKVDSIKETTNFVHHRHLRIIEQIGKPVSVVFYDLSGKIYQISTEKQIDISHLKPGVYILKTKFTTQKIIIDF